MDLIWGPWRRIVLAHATDPDVRFKGATGGVLTALAQYLVHSGEVAFVHHVKPHETDPTFGQVHISESSAQVMEGAGSRYGPTAPLTKIKDSLDRGKPFAFIGKPCDVSALRNLACQDERVNHLVKYSLTMVCGGFMPPAGMDRFLREDATDPSEVISFRYRGYGCPGPTRYETKTGKVREFRYTDFWGTDETQWMLPFRCKVCPDGIGECADIAASDTWPGGSPDPETEDADLGSNAMIIRTQAGMDLASAAETAGFLTIESGHDPRYMDSVQPHQRRKKLVVRARWNGLADEGRLVPTSEGLRLDALMEKLGSEEAERQRAGTRQRVQDGKTSEPKPAAPD